MCRALAESRAVARLVLGPDYRPEDAVLTSLAHDFAKDRYKAKAPTTLAKYKGPWGRFEEFVAARTANYDLLAVPVRVVGVAAK